MVPSHLHTLFVKSGSNHQVRCIWNQGRVYAGYSSVTRKHIANFTGRINWWAIKADRNAFNITDKRFFAERWQVKFSLNPYPCTVAKIQNGSTFVGPRKSNDPCVLCNPLVNRNANSNASTGTPIRIFNTRIAGHMELVLDQSR